MELADLADLVSPVWHEMGVGLLAVQHYPCCLYLLPLLVYLTFCSSFEGHLKVSFSDLYDYCSSLV